VLGSAKVVRRPLGPRGSDQEQPAAALDAILRPDPSRSLREQRVFLEVDTSRSATRLRSGAT
jgi:hypothetical protein